MNIKMYLDHFVCIANLADQRFVDDNCQQKMHDNLA